VVYNIVHDNAQRGASKEAIDEKTEQIYATAKTVALQRVKASFVFQAVAEKEGVRVEQVDVLLRMQELAAQYKIPVDKLYKDVQKSGRINDIINQILTEKVINLLVQFAHIQDSVAAPTT
jgi:FKBP-type peptidyl-prolyl cis-trans isomerase (trigger factor)